jgi:phage shock protein PspC (stress-responsive transcriptional regulator)
MIKRLQTFLEDNALGVCDYLGSKLGIKSSTIRLYFIYLSFFTFGSPIIVYLALAFLIEHKDYFKQFLFRTKERPNIWEL